MRLASMAAIVLLTGCAHADKSPAVAHVWRLDDLDSVGGLAIEKLGAPKLISENGTRALCFDGRADGIFLPRNPIEGWPRFTIEIRFRPDGDGAPEQRFLHIEDTQGRRALIETRMKAPGAWSLDTFLRADDTEKLTLLDRSRSQSTDRWHWAALVYDGGTMTHYVDGQKQLEGHVKFPVTGPGRTSLGVRQNRIHWFKGCISEARFTPRALPAKKLRREN